MARVRSRVRRVESLPSSLSHWPGYVMRHVFDAWFVRYEREVAQLGLSVNGLTVLVALDAEGPATQAQLSDRMGIDRSTMVAVIDELEGLGFVERRRGEGDRRAVPIHVTETGRDAAERSRELTDRSNDEVLAGLTAGEREAFLGMLARMADVLAAEHPRA